MIVHSRHISLFQVDDKPELFSEIARIPSIARNLTEKWSYPSSMPDTMVFAVEEDEQVIGQAALKSIRWFNRKAELSLFLRPESQGRKLGREALVTLMHHAFFQLNLYRLEAEVIDYNEPAMHLVEKLGFVQEGRLRQARYFNGKYYDILRYGILKPEFEAIEAKLKSE